jgi:hypothetical protein
MLLEHVTHQGYWRLTGSDVEVPGTFTYSPEKGGRLTLNGAFNPPDFIFFGGGEPERVVIHGRTNAAGNITLLDCLEDGGHHFPDRPDAYSTVAYRVRLALIGEHFDTADDVRFVSVVYRAPNLEEFIAATGIRQEPPQNPTELSRFVVDEVEDFTFPLAEFTGTTLCEQSVGGTFARLVVEEKASIRIDAATPRHFEDFQSGPVKTLHTLMELAVDAPLPIEGLTGVTANGHDVTMLYSQRHPQKVEQIEYPVRLPFNLRSLGDRRETVIARWQQARETCGPTLDLYFSVMRAASLPVEHQFLFLIQALESFHRQTRLTQKRMHLAERLKALLEEIPPQLRPLFGDPERFAREFVATRNYLTHFDEKLKSRALTGVRQLWPAVQLMKGMLKLLFVQLLGLEESNVLDTVWGGQMQQLLMRAAAMRSKATKSSGQ